MTRLSKSRGTEGALQDRIEALEAKVTRLSSVLRRHLARPRPLSRPQPRRSPRAESPDLAQLANQVDIPDEAREYLQANPSLTSLIPRIADKVREYFGDDASIRLELVTFPEVADDRELFALVSSPWAAAEAAERLARFDEDWWVDALAEIDCQLTVDIAS